MRIGLKAWNLIGRWSRPNAVVGRSMIYPGVHRIPRRRKSSRLCQPFTVVDPKSHSIDHFRISTRCLIKPMPNPFVSAAGLHWEISGPRPSADKVSMLPPVKFPSITGAPHFFIRQLRTDSPCHGLNQPVQVTGIGLEITRPADFQFHLITMRSSDRTALVHIKLPS